MGSGFGIDSWIIVGTVAGWVTALLTETVEQFEWLETVLVGILARSFAEWCGVFDVLDAVGILLPLP